jgi:Tfp pilus assembly protein FimV
LDGFAFVSPITLTQDDTMSFAPLISRPGFAPRTLPLWMAVWLALAAASGANPALAADQAASSASALKVLLGPAALVPVQAMAGRAGVSASQDQPGQALQVQTVTVQRGETLDRVIRRALPHLPLHADFLRQAFVSLNPQAFPSGSAHLLRTGSTLQVPSMAALRQMMVQQNPAAAAFFEVEARDTTAAQSTVEKRGWVRFP